ncbi:serine/threonine-protein kinase [Paractinoplanes brasiliensis]|uniref:non-specific serine/threonine protein kinase n=2 Tax=Paractinoplanes brasiliensis TaxID=52695 RepID=A0A4R6K053_9ACTN|nr:serine/threonine-protein kinase [Actinoplanes brasiliensis]GID27141.1 hypothetical protein Abr02nite_21240 [Actinoplanes brasiliensis]
MWGHMSTTDLPGSSLLAGRYRLVERLGAGGMSVVWRGFDEVLGRQVAVKVLPPSTSADPAFRRRLRAEAQAAARLSHPNITNVYDYGEATTVDGEPVPYVVMELIDGESLAAVLARVRKLPWQHAVRITAEVAAALAAAHSRGIVHRDVTPANVMLTPTGAKVVDFGISALIGENDIDPDGSLLGTPAYLAPERLEGGQVSPATDVYAVGLLIYRTLIGQLPWDVGTTTALLRAHQYTEPEPLPVVEGLPAEVDALVGRCLEKRPSDRPSSAELAKILAALAQGAPATARGYVPEWSDGGEDTTILPSPQAYAEGLAAGAIPVSPAAAGAAPVSPAAAGAAPVSPAGPAPAAEPVGAAEDAQSEPAAPARNSRFGDLPSGPVYNAAPVAAAGSGGLRPAYGNQPDGPDTPGGSTSPSWSRISQTKTRRVLVVALGVLLLGVGTYGWTLTGAPGENSAKGATPAAIPQDNRCVVSYAVWSDKNSRFLAQVTVANRNETPIKDWNLWFIMPGDQVVSGAGQVDLTQESPQGGAVTVNSAQQIEPLKTVSLKINGRYGTSNVPPMAFKLNGQQCETFVSSKPNEPSRYVEHLANGQTRLGPTTSPIPGISIGDDGIINVTPTKPGSTSKPGVPGTTAPPESRSPTTPPPTTPPPTTVPPTPPPPTTPPPTTVPPTPPPPTTPPPVTTDKPTIDAGGPEGCDDAFPEDCETP